jgi:DNA-binding response OmpR family regulator
LADLDARPVLVVHPDNGLRAKIVAVLESRGHRVSAAPRADRPVEESAVVVVDHRSVPWSISARILALVPGHDEEAILDAFAAGADDVLAGPLRATELASRVAGLLRRPTASPALQVGPLLIDPLARRVSLAGRPLELTRREFELLARLAAAPGRVVTKEELLRDVWSQPPGRPTRRLDTNVARLRQRLGEHRALLVTVWGVGYRLGG